MAGMNMLPQGEVESEPTSGDLSVVFTYISTATGVFTKTIKKCDSGGSVTAPTDAGNVSSTIGTAALLLDEHPALTFQGWNITTFTNITHDMNVGAMYITTDGKTYSAVRLNAVTGLSPTIYLTTIGSGTLTVEWGDSTNSTSTTIGMVALNHTYSVEGDYWIKISRNSGTYTFGGGGTTTTYVGGSTQNYRSSLISCYLGSEIDYIGDYAFYYCYSLSSIIFPSSVISIGSSTFYRCYSLSITIPDSVTSIGANAFYQCYSLSSLTIPNSVTSIGTYAFSTCNSLSFITIPDSVTSIGTYTFNGCYPLSSLTIPNSVTSIGTYAFYFCIACHEYILQPITPPTLADVNAFGGMSSSTRIYVPDDSLTAYRTATNWATYANYIYPISQRL